MAADALQVRLARLEEICEQIDKRLSALEARMDDRFGALDPQIDSLSWRLVVLIPAIVGSWFLRP